MKPKRSFLFWCVTVVMIFASHHVMTYLHEWTHGLIAWLGGVKQTPFDIHYGDNWVTLWGIDEDVPYQALLAEGKNRLAAAIAISPMISGVIFFFVGLKLLASQAIRKRRVFFSFVYWWTLMEIGEFYSYIPIRTFADRDDIFNFTQATGLSPWIVILIGVPFVIWGLQEMIRVQESQACFIQCIESRAGRFVFLFLTLIICFWYYGGIAFIFVYPKISSCALCWVSLALIPICLILLRDRYMNLSSDS